MAEKKRHRKEKEEDVQDKTKEDVNNDGRIEEGEKKRDTELLQHTNRKHVTRFGIKTPTGSNVASRE